MIDYITAAELADFSYNEYGLPSVPTGWTPIVTSTQSFYGFTANTFFDSTSNTLVIGFGGTSSGGDLLSDAVMAITGSSDQEAFAVSYSRAAIIEYNRLVQDGLISGGSSPDLVFVGHSLGGVLAQRAYLANPSGVAMVFNSPGIGGFWGAQGLAAEGVQYYFSNPSTWWQPSGPGFGGAIITASDVHNLGDLLNDNVYFIMQAEGHGQESIIVALTEKGAIPLSADQWGAIISEQLRNGDTTWAEVLDMLPINEDIAYDFIMAAIRQSGSSCFYAGTLIAMESGNYNSIENIKVDDWVMSYNRRGILVPGRVTRTMRKLAKNIIDVFGIIVTPGHVTFCGDGPFAGRHVPIIDILRSDGALVRLDGNLVRAATGVPVGEANDRLIWTVTGTETDEGFRITEAKQIRLGTRFILQSGEDFSVAELIAANGGDVTEDGLITTAGKDPAPFHWPLSSELPKPEDYVLQRSCVTLEDIYDAAEWEGVAPVLASPLLPAVDSRRPEDVRPRKIIRPNVPLALREEHRTGEIGNRSFTAVASVKHKSGH